MNTILLIAINVALTVIIFLLVFTNSRPSFKIKGISDDQKLFSKDTYFTSALSQPVIDVYASVLTYPERWILDDYTLENKTENISIWAANSWYDRRFYKRGHGLDDTHENKTKNNSLTFCDKILLERIVLSYRSRQGKLITKFFI